MIRSLTSGISGMQQFQQRLDVIGNNISNVNTTGFKSARVDFEDAFSQTIQAASPGSANTSTVAGIQIGSGVTTAAVRNLFTQGAISRTGVQTDLAVSGDGFFVVKDPVTSADFVTRSGDFRIDQNGYLITNRGFRVQGFTDSTTDKNLLTTIGDLRIDRGTPPPSLPVVDANAEISSFSIDNEGVVTVRLTDGREYIRGQVLMQAFRDPQALMKEGGNLYSGISNAGPLGGGGSPNPRPPGTNGLGRIQSGALELANVDLATEFSNMITTQRAFQASARIITTSDEILQELVNLKR